MAEPRNALVSRLLNYQGQGGHMSESQLTYIRTGGGGQMFVDAARQRRMRLTDAALHVHICSPLEERMYAGAFHNPDGSMSIGIVQKETLQIL
jgi:hypothetical protein